MSTITISIIAKDNAKTIARTIDSVVAQDFQDWQLIVVISKSEDGTLAIAKSYEESDHRIKLLVRDEVYSWANGALLALEYSETPFFMWLDADDYIEATFLDGAIRKLRDSNFIGCAGMVVLTNNEGVSELPNISSRRIFRFASSRWRSKRLLGYCFTPECFGAVNLLYSVWNTQILRETVTWQAKEDSMNFDQTFILKALIVGRILQTPNMKIFRENGAIYATENESLPPDYKHLQTNLLVLIWYLLISPPPRKEYGKVIRNMSLRIRIFVEGIMLLRSLIAVQAGPLERVRDYFRKIKAKRILDDRF